MKVEQYNYAALGKLDLQEMMLSIYKQPTTYQIPKEDYFKKAFVVVERETIVAIACCFINPYITKNALLIGGYESQENGNADQLLFKEINAYALNLGLVELIGPISGSTWDKHRFTLTQKQAFLGEDIHPTYYSEQWRKNGFETAQAYLSAKQTEPQKEEKYKSATAKFKQNGIVFRKIDLANLENELKKVYPLVCASFKQNIYYSPISEDTFISDLMQKEALLDDKLIWLAFDGAKCVGFVFCYRNLIDAEQNGIIAKTLARHPDKKYAGLGTVLSGLINAYVIENNIDYVVHAFMHKNNVSNNVSKTFLGEEMNTYALFKKELNANCIQHFYHNFEKKKKNIALQLEDEQLTFEALDDLIQKKASYLQEKGIVKGDRVIILLGISKALYVNLLALFFIGAVPVVVDKWSGFKRLKQSLKLADAKAYIASKKLKVLALFVKEINAISTYLNPNKTAINKAQIPTFINSNDPALITFTTGSTGTPKGSIRTHQNLNAQFERLAVKLNATANDLVITNLPIVLLINLGKGASTYIPKISLEKLNTLKTKALTEKLGKIKPNILIGSPYFAEKLCSIFPENQYKQVIIGGGPVFPKNAQNLIALQPKINLEIVYGSTECEPVSSLNGIILSKENLDNGLLVGKIDEKTDLKIVDIHTAEEITETNEIGEIIVAGEHVVASYFRNEKAISENKIWINEVLYHKMGDAGSFDANGNLHLHGRVKYLPQENGKLFSLLGAESKLNKMNDILEATVIFKNGNNQLFYSSNREIDRKEFENCLPFAIGKISRVNRLPKDKRHNTKIDYGKL